MTVGGDLLTPDESRILEHVGVKGMRWGVRRTPAQRKQHAKEKAVKKSDKAKYKLESRLNAGEVVASMLLGGPIGLIGYKMVKRGVAETKLENKKLSAQKQQEAAAKIGVGKAIAVTAVTGPVGLITYAGAKAVASRQVDDF